MLRFASSPAGDMHIGDLRVAIFNYLIAQQCNEPFNIRIIDIDKSRNIEGKDTEIMQILEKFALIHESVFHQSEHLHMYQTMAIKLLEQDNAFVCTCISEKQEADNECSHKCEEKEKTEHSHLKESGTPFVIRIKKPTLDIDFRDTIQGNIAISKNKINAFIILHEDGTPTEDFASACDDMLSDITMIIDETKHLLNRVKQIHIKEQLGFNADIKYAHIPDITNANDASVVKWLFQEGYIPDAIINYLLLLGNPKAPKKIFTLPEAIKWFKLEHISNTEATFDIEKLRFINREHLKRTDDKVLSSLFGFADADVGKLVKLYLEEASTINELALKIRPIFAPKVFKDRWEEEMRSMQEIIADAPMINDFNDFSNHIMKISGLKNTNFTKPLRLLLTGAEDGPELSNIYPLIKSYLLEIAS